MFVHVNAMYDGDSFYTLSLLGRTGLIALAGFLMLIWFGMAWVTLRGRVWWFRIGAALVCFVLFIWLSPQIFYQYYHLLFDGLPHQWVIKGPPPITEVLQFLTFTGPATLSAHSVGALGWALIGLAVLGNHLPISRQNRG